MPKFKYRYEKILNLKKDLEEEAKNRLAIEIQNLMRLKKELISIKNEQEEYLKYIEDEIAKTITGAMLFRINKNKEFYGDAISKIDRKIEIAEGKILKRRKELNLAVIESKKFEKMKEKYIENFKDEMNASERLETEELVNYKNYTTSGDNDGK